VERVPHIAMLKKLKQFLFIYLFYFILFYFIMKIVQEYKKISTQ